MQNNKAALTPPKSMRKTSGFRYTLSQYWRYRHLTLMLLVSVTVLIIFKYVPIYGLQIAFKKFKILEGIWGSPWVGLANFKKVFSMPGFTQAFMNTIILGGLNLLFGFPLQILLALLLNELTNLRFKKTVQTFSYLPHFISWVTLSGLFIQFLSPSTGPVAALYRAMGLTPYYFMGEVSTFRGVLVVTNIWKSIGWGSIIYLAALSTVNQEMYEAAIIDGATRFQRVHYITIPSIAPTITIMLILTSGSILNDNFDQVYNMMNAAVYSVANNISVLTYELGLKNMKYSLSTAIGLFKNVIAFGLVILANTISKRVNDYGIW
ncbi:MAG TPA: ABC transporter permease subunit [Candidatus Limiplasma sp.]|nr:ABC transporter permease subunit [Candidatus Limiplasma sp.]